MRPLSPLPDSFLRELDELERAYLRNSDPIEQSGFYGGPERWRAEREPILDAVPSDGEILDTGCANGYLLECLVAWARERGVTLTPYGLDQGRDLVELARQRQPHIADHFFVGNAWDWKPPRRFRYVYTLLDQVPPDYLLSYLHRLFAHVVAPGGRLIVGDYGSHSRGIRARDVVSVLRSAGCTVLGEAEGGNHGVARFAWSIAATEPIPANGTGQDNPHRHLPPAPIAYRDRRARSNQRTTSKLCFTASQMFG